MPASSLCVTTQLDGWHGVLLSLKNRNCFLKLGKLYILVCPRLSVFFFLPTAYRLLLPRHQLKKPNPIPLQKTRIRQLLPDLLPKPRRRLNRNNLALRPGQRRMAEPRIFIELRKLQSFLKSLEGLSHIVFVGGHLMLL